jgi:hypothetical protein
MQLRYVTFVGGLAMIFSLTQGRVAAQSQPVKTTTKATNQSYKAPRTVDGQPDLQGVWANNVATPLQRPKELEGQAYLTDEELNSLKKAADKLFSGQSDAAFGDTVFLAALANVKGTQKGFVSTDGKTGDYSSVWTVERDWTNRTSLIVDPPDGHLPELTERAKALANRPSYDEGAKNGKRPDSYEDIGLTVRCITFGSPSLLAGYDSYYQIIQSAKTVAIVMEKIHDARIIPLDGSPHPPSNVKLWHGDSRGHWEGETLVIDTTNYREGAVMNNTDKLHVIERITRTASDVVTYKVTFDDPGTWAKPWTAEIPWRHSNEALFEYACHEGNYGIVGILAGARAQDAQDGGTKTGSQR